eukprot:SAG31_NODE_17266_length_677_cov_1.192042_1_plen_179_part_10
MQGMLWSSLHCAGGERTGGREQLSSTGHKQGSLEPAVGGGCRRHRHREEEWQESRGDFSKSWLIRWRGLLRLYAAFSAAPSCAQWKCDHVARVSSTALPQHEATGSGSAAADYSRGECVHPSCKWRERVARWNEPTSATHPDNARWLSQVSHFESQSCAYVLPHKSKRSSSFVSHLEVS